MVGSSDYSCRHDAEPKAALEALVHHDGPLLLDLDETAFLRKSTESGRPCRRRQTVGAFARSAGYEFVGEYYVADASGRVAISKPQLKSVIK